MMAEDNEVLIKVAADIAQAVQSLATVATSMGEVVESISTVNQTTEQTEATTKSFWETWVSGTKEGEVATVAWGNILAKSFETLQDGVSGALKSLPNLVSGVASAGDEMKTLSNQVNVSVEGLAELKFISSQSGASMQGMARTIQGLGGVLGDSSGKAAKAIEAMGLSVAALQAEKPEEAFFKILDAIKQTTPVAEQGQKAMDIFGGRFRMNTMLLKEDIGGLRREFKELGGGMTTDLAEAGDTYSDSLAKISLVQDNFKNQIAGAVLPAVNSLLEAMPNLGGAVLLAGDAFGSFAQSMLPVISNMLLLKGPGGFVGLFSWVTKIGPAIAGLATGIGSLSGALAVLTGPIGLTVAALTALGALLWKLVGGWEGVKEIAGTIIELFQDIFVIVTHLTKDAILWLVDAVKDVIKWFSELPIIGTILQTIGAVFSTMIATVQAGWEKLQQFVSGVIKAFTWMGKIIGSIADDYRAAPAVEAHTAALKENVIVQKTVAEKLALLKAGLAKTKDEYEKIDPKIKATVAALLQQGVATKEIHDATKISMGALEAFKAQLEKNAKAAEKNKPAIQELVEDLKTFSVTLGEARKSGAAQALVLEKMGKAASDFVERAKLIKGGLEKIPGEIQALAAAWDAMELDKKAIVLRDKLAEVTKGATEMARAFGQNVTASTTQAIKAAQAMADEIRLSMMSEPEARLERIAMEEKRALEAVAATQRATQVALTEQVEKIQAVTKAKIAAEQEFVGAGKKVSAERLAMIAAEEAAAIAAAKAMSGGTALAAQVEVEQIKTTFAHKRELVQKAHEYERQQQTAALAYMEKNRAQHTASEIRAQREKVRVLNQSEELRGRKTKAVYLEELQVQRDTLAAMTKVRGEFTDADIQKQKEVVKAAEVAAGKIKVDWRGALDTLSAAFAQLAQIAGGTFGGIAKSVGETVASVNVMAKGLKSAFSTDGLGGIGKAFGDAKGGAQGFGGLLKGLTGALPGIGTAISGIMSAVSGAIQIGKKIFDGLTQSKGEKAAKTVGTAFGVKITEEAGNAIAKTADKLFKGDRFTAALYEMKSIVEAAGGITEQNFKKMTSRLHDVFSALQTGKMNADQARKVLDENFGAFADHVLKSGKVASKEFLAIIKLNRDAGTSSKAIMEFVTQQSDRLGAAMARLGGGLDDNNESIERFERLSVAAFNAAVASGVPYVQAIQKLGPALDKIIEKNTKLGRTSGAAVNELLRFREITAANEELVESASALNEVMLALSNVGGLNAETMADLQAQGKSTFDQLKAAGFSDIQVLQQMKGFLESVRDAHAELGLPIDENTQALIDQATASGVLKAKQMSTNDIMMEGFGAIIKALGGEIPEAFKKMTKSAVDSAKEVQATLKDSAQGWHGWSTQAVEAVGEVEDAVNAVSFGKSPGGLKEIPLKLMEAVRAFREFEAAGLMATDRVSAKVDALQTPDFGSTTQEATEYQLAGRAHGRAADAGVLTGEDVTKLTEALKTSNLSIKFDISTVNADGLKTLVEQDILPKIIDAVDRNNRGSLTKLRQLMEV